MSALQFSPFVYNKGMDEIDVKIINCLIENARINLTDLAARAHLSASATSERVRKLESEGIISRYSAIINYDRLGYDVTAYMDVILDDPSFKENIIAFAAQNPDIVECDYVAGDFDFLLKISTRNTRTLEHLLTSVRALKGVGRTRTTLVLSNHKQAFSPMLTVQNKSIEKKK